MAINKSQFKLETVKKVQAMSMAEFKAWLEGFSECFKTGSPNKMQWKRISERLAAVNVQQEIVYRSNPLWWPTWYSYNISSPLIGETYTTGNSGSSKLGNSSITCNATNSSESMIYAATEIGKTEALEFTA